MERHTLVQYDTIALARAVRESGLSGVVGLAMSSIWIYVSQQQCSRYDADTRRSSFRKSRFRVAQFIAHYVWR